MYTGLLVTFANALLSVRLSCIFECLSGTQFSKALETFQACKAMFSSSVSKNEEVYMPETSCMKGTSVHIENT